jgi:RNA polymerase sigma-54 factor
MNQFQTQKMSQRLELRPIMLHSLEMLQKPILELDTFLKNELIENPMLDLQEEDGSKEDVLNTENSEEIFEDEECKELTKTLEEAKELSEILDSWNDFHTASYGSDPEKKVSLEVYTAQKINSKDIYLQSLENLEIDDNELDFAEVLVDATDQYGFLPINYDIILNGEVFGISAERSKQIHRMILDVDPKGICARNIKECLLVQLNKSDSYYELSYKIIKDEFDDFIHRRYDKLTEKFNVTYDDIMVCRDKISKLDPKPGLRIQNSDAHYVLPDVFVKRIDDNFEVIVNDFSIPKIRLSSRYKDILKDVKKDKHALGYVRDKINSAKFLIKSMYMRNRTLERVMKSIINNQRSFFYDESGILEPLGYSVISNELQLNESTISRVIRNKYADTPFGLIKMRNFFTSIAGKDKNFELVSKQQVQKLISKLIADEDKQRPLSDNMLMKIIKEHDISVSRRVIAKYREDLGILNSRLRRKG